MRAKSQVGQRAGLAYKKSRINVASKPRLLNLSIGKGATEGENGAPGGIRTPNLLIRSQMLYPLSYGRKQRTVTLHRTQFSAKNTAGTAARPLVPDQTLDTQDSFGDEKVDDQPGCVAKR